MTVAAGPFASIEALRASSALSRAARVRSVMVRGYEGADRAILDVHLSRPNAVVFGPWPGTISFARGAPSLDIVDVDGLRAAADAGVHRRSRAG